MYLMNLKFNATYLLNFNIIMTTNELKLKIIVLFVVNKL